MGVAGEWLVSRSSQLRGVIVGVDRRVVSGSGWGVVSQWE